MTFTEFKNLPISSKIVLVEFDVPAMPELDIFLNYEAGIWMTAITPGNVTVTGSDAQVGYYTNTNATVYYDITGLIVDIVNVYTKVYSLAELRLQNKGFWYDKTGSVTGGVPAILIHFDNWETPLGKLIQLKQVYGFCDKIDSVNGAYFNNTYYEPRIESVPTISKSKDPLFYGVVRFEGGSVTLNNADGFFDNFKDLNLYRQIARIKLGFDTLDYDDFETIFTGFVESYSWDFEKFTVKIQDKRKTLTGKIPENVFTAAEYPNIATDNINKPKPIGFGNIRKAALTCLNEEASPTPAQYEYYLSDPTYADIYSLSAVYVDNVAISSANYDLFATTGILKIDAASVTDHITDVTASFCPRAIYNGHEVVKTILYNYADVNFNTTTYYVAEWNQAQMNARDIEIYIDEPTDILEIVNKCMDASDAIFLIKDDGRFSSRLYDDDRAAAETIENFDWIGNPSIDLDESQFLSEVTVNYNPEYSSGKKKTYINTAYKSEVIARYAGEQSKEYDTIIETLSDATAKSESIMFFSKEIKEIVKRQTILQHFGLEVMDFVKSLPKIRYGDETINQLWEVLGRSINLTSGKVDLTLRFVKTYVPEPPTLYQTGWLWNHKLWGHKLYEVAYE